MLAAMSMLIADVIRRNAEVVPDAVAASLGEAILTHAELERRANRLARGLREQGVGYGDRVVTWADTRLDVLPLFVALAKLGAVFAPLNARLSAEEALPIARLARPSLFVSDPERAAGAATIASELAVPLARLGGAGGAGIDLARAAAEGNDSPVTEPRLQETDPHVLFFTSGSTGAPKGVVLSHRANFLRTFQGVFRDLPERSVCMFPLFHMAAFTLALAAWQTRGEIALVAAATADEILAAVERRRANRLYCIPAVWARILEIDPGKYDSSSLREVDTGTSATPIELVRALKARFPGTATRIYYGSTEVGSGTTLPDALVLEKPGSVGPASPGVDLAVSESGEILLRSSYVMDGYFDAPDATAEVLRDGWFHTGDLGVLDADRCLSIVGRVKELIRTGGESVAPAEVEAVLAEHPGVGEVAVVGVPDPQWGELVCAVVVAAGAPPRLEDLQVHCEGRLAGFKKPRRLECVDALPRTAATGQLQRTLLVEQILSR
jgi:acyl-CoA synthetase (AMP-forming)/AMP-acid ligase II